MALRSLDQLQANFAAGEIDPEMRHRSDIGAYDAGVEVMINFLPRLHGGIRTKPGTIFYQDLQGTGKLLPFVFSETQAYIMVLTNLRLDIFYQDGTVAEANITAPWTTAQIPAVNMLQAADVAFFVHKDIITQTLTRIAANDFTLANYGFDGTVTGAVTVKHCPFYRFAATGMTLNPGASGSGSSHTLTTSANFFESGHVGLRIRHKFKQILITAVASATSATGTNQEALDDTDATSSWDEEVFTGIRGYPRAVCMHDNRLIFGGSRAKKSGIWLSKVGEFFNFDVDEGEDNDAIWSGIDDDRVQEVRHLLSHGHVQIFCDDMEAFIPETATAPITPENFAIRSQTRYGILENVPPAILDEGTIYAQRYGTGIREYMFTDLTQRYNSDLVSVLNARAIIDPQSLTVVASSPDRPELYAYFVMSDGSMAVLHSLRAEKIVAWTRWNTPNGNYKSVCNILGKIWLLVERTINVTATVTVTDWSNIAVGTELTFTKNDGTVITLESEASSGSSPSASVGNTHFFRPITSNNATADNIFTALNAVSGLTVANPASNVVSVIRNDSGLENTTVTTTDAVRLAITNFSGTTKYYLEQFSYDTVLESAKLLSGTNTTFSGLSHLDGLNVHAVQDNISPIGTAAVSGGSVTFDESSTAPHVGLYSNATITTLPIESKQDPARTSLRRKRIAQAVIGVKDGVALSAGSAGELLIHNVTDDFSLAPTAKTQRLRVFPTGFSDDATLTVTSTVPVPITILSLAYRIAV